MSTPRVLLVCLGLTSAAWFCHLLGNSTDYWFKMGSSNSGLWKSCTGIICGYITDDTDAKFNTARAFSVLGLLTGGTAFTFLAFYTFYRYVPLWIRLSAVFSLTSACSVLITVVCYTLSLPSDWREHLNWSFYMSGVGMLLFAVNTGTIGAYIVSDRRAAYTTPI